MVTETLEKILDEHPLFRGMNTQHLRTLVESATVVRFEPGDVIFEEGEPAHRFYLIRTGRVALQLVSYRTRPFTPHEPGRERHHRMVVALSALPLEIHGQSARCHTGHLHWRQERLC